MLGSDNLDNLGKSISSIVLQSGRTVTDASLIFIWGCKEILFNINCTRLLKFEMYPSLAPFSHLSFPILFSVLKTFVERLHHALLLTTSSTTTTHVSLVAPEAATLIRGFLNTSSVHQMESAFIFVVVISVLISGPKL